MNCVDWSDVEAAAQDCAGNHRQFDSFAWHDRPDENDEHWTIVYTHNRDSGLVEQSNADAIAKELEPFVEAGDVMPEHHGHWACGWIDGYAIRVYYHAHLPADGFADGGEAYSGEECREVTEAFQTWCYLQHRLSDYPVLDETDHSRREYEAALEAISSEGRRQVRDDAPKDWAAQVFSWLWDNKQRELDNRDDQGASPSWEAVREALTDLDLLDAWYHVRVGETTVFETQSRAKAEKEFANLCWHASLGLVADAQAKMSLWCDDDELLEEKGA